MKVCRPTNLITSTTQVPKVQDAQDVCGETVHGAEVPARPLLSDQRNQRAVPPTPRCPRE